MSANNEGKRQLCFQEFDCRQSYKKSLSEMIRIPILLNIPLVTHEVVDRVAAPLKQLVKWWGDMYWSVKTDH